MRSILKSMGTGISPPLAPRILGYFGQDIGLFRARLGYFGQDIVLFRADLVDEVAVVGALDLDLHGHRDLRTSNPSDNELFRAGYWANSGRILGCFGQDWAISGRIMGYFGQTLLTRWRS